MSSWQKWKRMGSNERRHLLLAWWRVLRVRLMLGLLGVARTQAILARSATTEQPADYVAEHWAARSQLLRRAAARVPGARCLARSMVLWWWMRRNGLRPTLHIGARSENGSVHAHAWVAYQGRAIDEPDTPAAFRDLGWPGAG